MSAITETAPGGEMVCILSFSARPCDGEGRPISEERRRFDVGERVRFVSFFFKDMPKDNPIGYMAVFEPMDPKDKNRYAATEVYFVTLDCWEGLRNHFLGKLIITEEKSFHGKSPEVRYKLTAIPKQIKKSLGRPASQKRAHEDAID